MSDTPQRYTQPNETDATQGWVRLFRALALLVLGGVLLWFVYTNATDAESDYSFRLGLDLAGGSHLVYEADVSEIEPTEVPELMNTLREVVERRVNELGTEENIVYVERSSFVTDEVRHRLVIELPGVTDVSEAVAEIGRTPLLEFKLFDRDRAQAHQELLDSLVATTTNELPPEELEALLADSDPYVDTGLTGRYLESARLDFTGQQGGSVGNEPVVSLRFNREGAQLFEEITSANVGEQLAIFLDGELVSSPNIRERISGGNAIISGGFTATEARDLARNLNLGALPVPIELASTQTIGASLGAEVLDRGVVAGVIGLSLVCAFMLLWYRMPGIVAIVALLTYVSAMFSLFMFIPVTLTAAGLAGFILSLGMAVDANVLVFERMKELYRAGESSRMAAFEGFTRAWSAIRDGNVTSLLSAVVLYWFGTSLVQGFALVFGIGIIVSMLTAVLVTRSLLVALPESTTQSSSFWRFIYHSGHWK